MHVNFKAEWKKRADLVEEGLLRELKKVPAYDETLEKAMEYSLMAGGKRLHLRFDNTLGGCDGLFSFFGGGHPH